MRKSLLPGNSLLLDKKNYLIDDVIGEGASCIVYAAHLTDDGCDRKVRIKELYPAKAYISRETQELVWKSEEERKREFLRFRDTYRKHVSFQNNPMLGNVTAHIVDSLIEENNTLYMVIDVDNGSTFDREKQLDYPQVIQIMIALAHTIAEYHRQGFVHLDIKPQNFLVLPETKEIVKLIDVDSVLPLDKLRSGEVEALPFTPGWSAPELEQRRLSSIGVWTDIFSVCAILFERIFHRKPDSDDIGVFKRWNVSEVFEGRYVPSAAGLLTDILTKGLQISVKKRYASMEELINALKDVLRLMKRESYIKSSYFSTMGNVNFVGRDNELLQLHTCLADNHAVFVCGFGGSGKTTLVQRYVELYKYEYEAVVFFRYEDSLDDFIRFVPIENLNSEDRENRNDGLGSRMRKIKELSSDKTLFIIDNFDTAEDYRLEDVLSIDGKFIFTTRVREQNIVQDDVKFIELEALGITDCVEIIKKELGSLDRTESDAAEKIITHYECHTMTVSLVAKYALKSGRKLCQIWDEMKDNGIKSFGEDSERFQYRKDGINKKDSVLGHLRELFGIMELSKEQIAAMESIYYLTKIWCIHGVSGDIYKKYTGMHNLNILDDMVERGLITRDSDYLFGGSCKYYLHTSIGELYESLSRSREEVLVYQNAKEFLESGAILNIMQNNQISSITNDIFYDMRRYMRIFLLFAKDEETLDRTMDNTVCLMVILQSHHVKNIFKMLFTDGYAFNYSEEFIAFSKLLFARVMRHINIQYRGGVIPWWYSEVVTAVSYFRMNHALKKDRQMVVEALIDANRGISEHVMNTKNQVFLEYDRKVIVSLVEYEADILNTCILYSGKTIYNNQRDLLSACAHKYRENNGTLIGIRKDYRINSTALYVSLYNIINEIRKKINTESENELQWLMNRMVWNIAYMQGEFINPYELNDILVKDAPFLYEQDRKNWESRYTASVLRFIDETENRYWMYWLLVDDVFLVEQPDCLVSRLCESRLLEKIWTDEALTEEQREYLKGYALDNSNKFMSLFRRKYKGKAFTRRYRQLIKFYSQQYGKYWEDIRKLSEKPWDLVEKLLWNQIVFGVESGKEAEVNEQLKQLFVKGNNQYIEAFVMISQSLKRFGYRREALLVDDVLLAGYQVQFTDRAWKIQVRNAVALSRIAPYWGKDSLRKQYTSFVAAKLSPDMCITYLQQKSLHRMSKLWAVNIAFRDINDRLAEFLYENREMPASQPSWMDEIKVQCSEIISLLEKDFTQIEYQRQEEIYLLAQTLKKPDDDKNGSILIPPPGIDEDIPESFDVDDKFLLSDIDLGLNDNSFVFYRIVDNNNYARIALRWYKKRKCYDEKHRYIGEKYLYYLYKACGYSIVEYVVRYGECQNDTTSQKYKELISWLCSMDYHLDGMINSSDRNSDVDDAFLPF